MLDFSQQSAGSAVHVESTNGPSRNESLFANVQGEYALLVWLAFREHPTSFMGYILDSMMGFKIHYTSLFFCE